MQQQKNWPSPTALTGEIGEGEKESRKFYFVAKIENSYCVNMNVCTKIAVAVHKSTCISG